MGTWCSVPHARWHRAHRCPSWRTWVCALLSSPPAPAGTLHGGKLLLGAFTLGFCQIPAGVSLGDAAKPPGCREAAWCRRSPYKPRRSANPSLPTMIPPPAPFFPALLADNATSVPDLKGALSGGCRCRGSPRIGGGPVAPAPLWDRGRLGAWGSKRSLLCLRVTKGVPVCLPPLLTCIIREPFIVRDCSG